MFDCKIMIQNGMCRRDNLNIILKLKSDTVHIMKYKILCFNGGADETY